jgi:hypothetical protein
MLIASRYIHTIPPFLLVKYLHAMLKSSFYPCSFRFLVVYDHVLFLMFGAMDIDCIYLLGHMIYHTFDHGTI